MKLLHLADLHLGKRVNEFPMIEDQRYILTRILEIIEEEKTDGVMIAGDVYDKQIPSVEAVQLFDDFLVRLTKKNQKVFMISGNHDSPERLAFGEKLLQNSEVYVSPVFSGNPTPVTLQDDYGELNIYLLPFVKPIHVKKVYPEDEINDYTDAIRTVISHMEIDETKRNVLLLHQFVAGASRCESEENSIGGLDDVSAAVLEPFDYVALGHLHGPQKVSKETIRYSGTPLKYSFSEIHHKKSATIVELKEKGEVLIKTIPLVPKRDFYELKGNYEELVAKSFYDGKEFVDGYLHITLTDEEDVVEALGRLRAIYPNIMKLDYDNARTRSAASVGAAERVEEKTPMELFGELYEKQNSKELSKEQREFLEELIEKIW